jgi:DnaJ-class molecular chaperone
MRHDKITAADFALRLETCPDCEGSGEVTTANTVAGRYDTQTCDCCDGNCEIERECSECCQVAKLNSDGVCRECAMRLTETISDPLKGLQP